MALPEKGFRKITVEHFQYLWRATGKDDYIHVTIASAKEGGSFLITRFRYYSRVIAATGTGIAPLPTDRELLVHLLKEGPAAMNERYTLHTRQQLQVTNYIIRQIILYALKKGWTPQQKGIPFHLEDVENHIDLRVDPAALLPR